MFGLALDQLKVILDIHFHPTAFRAMGAATSVMQLAAKNVATPSAVP